MNVIGRAEFWKSEKLEKYNNSEGGERCNVLQLLKDSDFAEISPLAAIIA